ncbi:hypothetical protein, partial [Pseudomonas aeruginosa]|uniref:hypothetical protein n=1 Tax=Pseudomonas aeruginosa TaxID=287 RepID=UPI002FE0B407
IVRDALLQRRITEQLVLFEVESTHRLGLASAEEDGRHFARATRALAFFNGLLSAVDPVIDRQATKKPGIAGFFLLGGNAPIKEGRRYR